MENFKARVDRSVGCPHKRGKVREDYKVDRWTGRVRHITTRKNKGTLIVPEGLSNNYSMI